MKAPKKIYFNPLLTEDGESIVKRCTFEKENDSQLEYIRSDVFIEKSENFLEMLGYGFSIVDNITHSDYAKEQLIKDFRNYMNDK